MIRGLRVPVHLTSREALRMFNLADIWAARTGHAVRLVSGNDHVHSRRSAHYEGLAVDFHSSDPDALSEVFRRAGYHVLWEVPGHYAHLHVEHVESDAAAPAARGDASKRQGLARAGESVERDTPEPVEGRSATALRFASGVR